MQRIYYHNMKFYMVERIWNGVCSQTEYFEALKWSSAASGWNTALMECTGAPFSPVLFGRGHV